MGKKKPAITKSVLPQAGKHLRDKLEEERGCDLTMYILFVVMLLGFLVWEWARYLFHLNPNPWSMSLAVVANIWILIRIIQRKRRLIHGLETGLLGEQAVGEFLDTQFRQKGYHIFHDIDTDRGNIDHVIVCRAGVFTIETKNISKPESGPCEIVYDGHTVVVNGFEPDRNPVKQSMAEALWMRDYLRDKLNIKTYVRAVVVYPGWHITKQQSDWDVWVLNPKALPKFLEHEDERLSSAEVKAIANSLVAFQRDKQA